MSDETRAAFLDRVWHAWVDVAVGFCIAVLLLAVTAPAQAQNYGSARIEGDKLIIAKEYIGSGDVVGNDGAKATVSRTVNAPRPGGGAPLPVVAKVPISNAAALKLGIKALGVFSGVGTVVALVDLLNDFRCNTQWGEGQPLPGLKCDPGMPPESQIVEACYRSQTGNTGPCTQAFMQSELAAIGMGSYSITGCWGNTTNFNCEARWEWSPGSFNYTSIGATKTTATEYGCAGNLPVGFDGKCPSGIYEPKTPAQVEAIIAPYPPQMTPAEYEALVREALGQLPATPLTESDVPLSPLETNVVQAYSPLAGGETITNMPDGSTVADLIQWNFGRINDTLGNVESYAITKTSTKTTTTPNGTTTTTTTTTGEPVPNDQPAQTDCDKFPDAAGCKVLGDPPSETVQIETRDVTWVQENLGLPAQCPAPLSFPIRGWNMQMEWTAACDIAPLIRAGILALTLLGVAIFVVKTVNGND